MRVGLVQYNPVWEDKEKNKRQLDILLTSLPNDVSLLVFPEMTLTGFTMSSHKHSERLKEGTIAYFSSVAIRFKSYVIAGFIERANSKPFNSLVFIQPDGTISTIYRKVHLITLYHEDQYYQQGESTVSTTLDDFKIGLSICYDLRFPELFRKYAKEGVDIMVNIANWPAERLDHWRTLLKARAIENQCYMVGVNRIGFGQNIHYGGYSTVVDPSGKEIVCGAENKCIITVDISKDDLIELRNSFQVLNDIVLL